MRTVGRIGWIRALMNVLTRSRGTPAAAFAKYWSRNVLVDKTPNCTGERRKTKAGRAPAAAGVGPRDSPLDVFDHVSSERSQELRLAEDDDLRGDALGT